MTAPLPDRPGAPDRDAPEQAYTDFTRSLSYGDYLQLDVLKARTARSRPRTTSTSSSPCITSRRSGWT